MVLETYILFFFFFSLNVSCAIKGDNHPPYARDPLRPSMAIPVTPLTAMTLRVALPPSTAIGVPPRYSAIARGPLRHSNVTCGPPRLHVYYPPRRSSAFHGH